MDEQWPEMATLYLTSASGGLFQRDCVRLEAGVKGRAAAHITTGAATKVHSMNEGSATQTVDLHVARCGYLEYLAEPTILFPRSSLRSTVRVVVEKGGCAILADSHLAHDPAGSHPLPFRDLMSEVAVYGERGELLVLDRMVVTGGSEILGVPGLSGRRFACASVYFLFSEKPPQSAVDRMREEAARLGNVYVGISTLPNRCGAWARMQSEDDLALQDAVYHLVAACRQIATGKPMCRRRK